MARIEWVEGPPDPEIVALLDAFADFDMRHSGFPPHAYKPDPAYPGDPSARCRRCHRPEASELHGREGDT